MAREQYPHVLEANTTTLACVTMFSIFAMIIADNVSTIPGSNLVYSTEAMLAGCNFSILPCNFEIDIVLGRDFACAAFVRKFLRSQSRARLLEA
jgi:hypothetical protein